MGIDYSNISCNNRSNTTIYYSDVGELTPEDINFLLSIGLKVRNEQSRSFPRNRIRRIHNSRRTPHLPSLRIKSIPEIR